MICLCLRYFPCAITKAFLYFGRAIGIIAVAAAAVSVAEALTKITFIPGLGSVYDAMDVLVAIVLVLPGAYVAVAIVSKLLQKPFSHIGKWLGINDRATLGFITTLANAVPTFGLIKDMDERGKVLNFAFLVSAGYLLGDHLAFASAVNATLVLPMLIGKLTGGITAVIVALMITRKSPENSPHTLQI